MKQKTEEKEKLTDEEIIDALCLKLIKGDSVSALCKDLSISEVQLFGYINQLKSNNVNVSLTNKAGDIILAINNSPDYTKENSFTIESNDKTLAETTKIGVISDLRFGSKSEQIALLNDMYKKFASDGVKYVIVAGNLLEGKYNSKDERDYGKSLITNDAYGQADHLIEYFPKVEGIQTLFITGDTDHTWSKELNVGEYIEQYRKDMT